MHDTANNSRKGENISVLEHWIADNWLDAFAVRDLSISYSTAHWVVVDDLFKCDALKALEEYHSTLTYSRDDAGLRYDSHFCFSGSTLSTPGFDLFSSPVWKSFVAECIGVQLHFPVHNIIKYRRHRSWSNGFWVHTDADAESPKAAMAIVCYLNRNWTAADGGILQFWEVEPLEDESRVEFYWNDYVDKRLDFLEQSSHIRIEAAGAQGLTAINAKLIDQIVPSFNRVVLIDFQSVPSFHSITPTREKSRHSLLQWLY